MAESYSISHEGTSFTPPSGLFGSLGFDLRSKIDITQIQGYRLTRPLDVLVYEAKRDTGKEFAVVYRVPSCDGANPVIQGRGATLEEACQTLVAELVRWHTALRQAPIEGNPQLVLERQYLDSLLIPE